MSGEVKISRIRNLLSLLAYDTVLNSTGVTLHSGALQKCWSTEQLVDYNVSESTCSDKVRHILLVSGYINALTIII